MGFLPKPKSVPAHGKSNNPVTREAQTPDLTTQSPGNKAQPNPADFTQQQAEQDIQLIVQSVTQPPAPKALMGIRVGPELSIEYEDNLTQQVELSNPLLRNLSPFMIRIEPPLIYGEQGGFQNQSQGQVATDFNAQSGNMSGYDRARRAIAQTGITGLNYSVGSPQELVVQNGSGIQNNNTAKGVMSDDKGNMAGHLGQPSIADLYTAVDIATQLAAALKTPPLVLLINPTTLAIARGKVQQFQERSRHGYVFQAWGEDQPKLSITARCGAFVSGGRGVQFASKRDSLAWQNLMNAFHFYRNNGYIHDTVGKSNAHLLVGALSIHYDGWIYFGHMESFTYTYDDEHMNGGVEFSIEFVASSILDTAQQTFAVTPLKSPIPSMSDPRYAGMTGSLSTGGEGQFSVSSEGLTTQGASIGVGDLFGRLVPQNAVHPFDPSARQQQGVPLGAKDMSPGMGSTGFKQQPQANTPGAKTVTQQNLSQVDPFVGN